MTQDQIQQKISALRADLDARGESIQAFCRRKNIDYDIMWMFLRGRLKGKRGKAHQLFVTLGLKPTPPSLKTKHRTAA